MASLGPCPVCGGVVATDATSCPHCGTKSFTKGHLFEEEVQCDRCNGWGYTTFLNNIFEIPKERRVWQRCDRCQRRGVYIAIRNRIVDLRNNEIVKVNLVSIKQSDKLPKLEPD